MSRARRRCRLQRSLSGACAAIACASALSSCAGTLKEGPIPHNLLEYAVLAPFPVYWLGGSFDGLAASEVVHDPSDAYVLNYGGCLQGGEGVCVPRLRIVTSPDNSFLPGGPTGTRRERIRGHEALIAEGGRTIVIATGPVVLSIYGTNAATALAAARTAVPINAVGEPQAQLPAALANTGFGERPLPAQLPRPLAPVP